MTQPRERPQHREWESGWGGLAKHWVWLTLLEEVRAKFYKSNITILAMFGEAGEDETTKEPGGFDQKQGRHGC